MTNSTHNRDREHAVIGAVTAVFTYSSHLSGKARIGGLSDDEARRLLAETERTKARLIGTLKPMG